MIYFVCFKNTLLFESVAHFSIGSFIFLVFSCMSCFYIFEINYLSIASFAIIFSHYEGCLFTWLIISFIVQKLLSPTLCNPMNHSTPGFPVHHQLPEFTQTHVHRVSDATQTSHPLSSTLLPPSIFPSIRVFSN